PAAARLAAALGQGRHRHAGELEAGSGRHHPDLGVGRRGEEEVSAGFQDAQAVPAYGLAEQVRRPDFPGTKIRRGDMKKLTALALGGAALVAACKSPPTQEQKSSVDYGPKPENYEQVIREYMRTRVNMDGVIFEFKGGPKPLYQQDTVMRPLQYG